MSRKIFLSSLILASSLVLSGCITVKTGAKTSTGADGGFFRSENRGDIWAQKTLIPTVSGKPNTFADSDFASIALDQSDENTIYFGTEGYGMLYTYDAGETWFVAKGLGQNTISAIAVDPKNHCIIYASVGNALKKSMDCARTWETKFADDNSKAIINHILVDNNNALKVFIGTTKGGLYKSVDGGSAWDDIDQIVEMRDKIVSLVMLPSNPQYLIVSLLSQGVYRSTDGGNNWEEFESLNEAIDEFKLGDFVKDIQVSKNLPDFFLAATSNGLLKSSNRGGKWDKVDIVTPEKKTDVSAIAFNPRNEQEMYYATTDIFYRSVDGGKSWASEKVVLGSRSARKIIVHPKRGEVIYLASGVYKE